MQNNIVLIGFMGSGKSTVGKAVADRLNLPFYDLDLYIEKKQNMKITEIFEKFGEEHFRRLETAAAAELSAKEKVVISCGGGTVLRKENADILKKNGRVFYLKIDAKTVIERLKDDCSRPLLQRDDKEAAINELLNKRSPIYEAVCDYKIDADSGVDSVVDRIIELSI